MDEDLSLFEGHVNLVSISTAELDINRMIGREEVQIFGGILAMFAKSDA